MSSLSHNVRNQYQWRKNRGGGLRGLAPPLNFSGSLTCNTCIIPTCSSCSLCPLKVRQFSYAPEYYALSFSVVTYSEHKYILNYTLLYAKLSAVYTLHSIIYRLRTIKQLAKHLNSIHNMTIEEEEKYFQTQQNFMDWKVKEETKTNSHYIQLCAPQLYGENEHYYFYCNRSGQYTVKGKGKRQIKTQGTSKAGSTCTAHIKAVKTLTTGKITAHYCSTHSNHSISQSPLLNK